jgi:hypothetical protein
MKWLLYILIIIAILLAANLMLTNCDKQTTLAVNVVTDTVYVERVKLVEVKVPVQPDRVLIQKEVDSLVLIKLAERKKEVIGIEKRIGKKNETYLNIQTITRDSVKVISQQEYIIPEDAAFVVDSEGNISYDEKAASKQSISKTIKDLLKAIGLAITFLLIGKAL